MKRSGFLLLFFCLITIPSCTTYYPLKKVKHVGFDSGDVKKGKFVNKGVVIEYVNTLPPPRLMYSVNHVKKQFDKDQKIVTSDLKVLMKSEIHA